MKALRRGTIAALAIAAAGGLATSRADESKIVEEGGVRYQVTTRTVQQQVPVTEMQPQQQTYYRQQLTTNNLQQQQLYTVPITQYQVVTRVHGRWNPFITPYLTYDYEPVTTWQQQVATVQIPVNSVAWVPDTRTVQTPVTTYKTANVEQVVSRMAMGASPMFSDAQSLASNSGPTATLAARPSAPLSSTPSAIGGQSMQSDPPRQASGWQAPPSGGTPTGGSTYR